MVEDSAMRSIRCESSTGALLSYRSTSLVLQNLGAKPLFHQKIAPNTSTYCVAFSPDGKKVAVAASDNKGYILNMP